MVHIQRLLDDCELLQEPAHHGPITLLDDGIVVVTERELEDLLISAGTQLVEPTHVSGRHDLVLEPTEKQEGDRWIAGFDQFLRVPNFVAHPAEVPQRWEHVRDHLRDAEESIFEDDSVADAGVTGRDVNRVGTAKRSAKEDQFITFVERIVGQMVHDAVCVQFKAGLGGLALRVAVPTVRVDKDAETHLAVEYISYRYEISHVARVGTEDEHGSVGTATDGLPDVERSDTHSITRRER